MSADRCSGLDSLTGGYDRTLEIIRLEYIDYHKHWKKVYHSPNDSLIVRMFAFYSILNHDGRTTMCQKRNSSRFDSIKNLQRDDVTTIIVPPRLP